MSDAEKSVEMTAENLEDLLQRAYLVGLDMGGYAMLKGVRELVDGGTPWETILEYIDDMIATGFTELSDETKADVDARLKEE